MYIFPIVFYFYDFQYLLTQKLNKKEENNKMIKIPKNKYFVLEFVFKVFLEYIQK